VVYNVHKTKTADGEEHCNGRHNHKVLVNLVE
jgi:hypothetical protein